MQRGPKTLVRMPNMATHKMYIQMTAPVILISLVILAQTILCLVKTILPRIWAYSTSSMAQTRRYNLKAYRNQKLKNHQEVLMGPKFRGGKALTN